MIPDASAHGLSIRVAFEAGFAESGPEQRAIRRGCMEMYNLVMRELGGPAVTFPICPDCGGGIWPSGHRCPNRPEESAQ